MDQYEKHQSEILSGVDKVSSCSQQVQETNSLIFHVANRNHCGCVQLEEGSAALPDPSLPLAHQLEFALGKIREHVRTILDTQATCKSLDEVQYCSFIS